MQEQEIDLLEIIYKLWNRRKFLFLFVLVFSLIGGAIAFVLPRQYVADCTLGLEVVDNTMRVKLEGLSAVQNMNMGNMREVQVVSPSMYPNILYSVPFQRELIHKRLFMGEGKDSVSFYEYYTHSKFAESRPENSRGVQNISDEEAGCMAYLKEKIILKVVDRDGYLKLSVSMPDAEMAAQMAQQAQEMLQRYITEFKVAKVQATLNFIEERYTEVKQELEAKQQALMTFREKNKNNTLAKEGEEKILNNEYELFFNLYADIVRQREQARMLVKENIPVLTVIEPVVLPSSPAKPNRMLIIAVTILIGGLVGCCWVLLSSSYRGWKNRQQN